MKSSIKVPFLKKVFIRRNVNDRFVRENSVGKSYCVPVTRTYVLRMKFTGRSRGGGRCTGTQNFAMWDGDRFSNFKFPAA